MAAASVLHGTIHATIFEIDRLKRGLFFSDLCGRGKSSQMRNGSVFSQVKRMVFCWPEIAESRIYATIDLDKARVGRSRTIAGSNPQWNESFHIYCAHTVSNVIFTVKYHDPVGARVIGRAYLSVDEILRSQRGVDRWLQLLDEDMNPIHGGSKIRVKLQFFDVHHDLNWSQGIKAPDFNGVPGTFFKQRKGCRVTLYPDAHMPDDDVTQFLMSKGYYKPECCWEDIFDAISNARHLIYIAGWSVYTKITLIRDTKRWKQGGEMSLGELLIKKANEGVNVLMLVWDDRTSVADFKKDGLMATHDQETKDYFQNTNVHCVLCPRNPDKDASIFQGIQVSTMFTHHQKSVIVDSEFTGGQSRKRSIVSFLGGIDLCDGRYDTKDHSLFRTLETVHHDDFHQPNFPGSSITKGGPREPWHDIHCRIQGPAAWDVLYNFEQRWKKQVGSQYLYTINELDSRYIARPNEVEFSHDNEAWNIQIFRSIDGAAAFDFPESPVKAAELGLIMGKDKVIDRSIQDAYIHAIRRAKNFIYIENQYFIGSSYDWNKKDGIKIEDINALNLIPKEISLKIVSKIQAGERFVVYIVLPMWPEGIPESNSVQAILDWQRRTMEMMYTDIANALKAKGISNADLRDYLMFFCLGNREVKTPEERNPQEKPEPDSDYKRAQDARRFMIYVHSKMMIVDDEYIIIGSANINQRSMDGARDTEIAMGGFQPQQITSPKGLARGQIFGFRMALWSEHLLRDSDTFLLPESIECVRNVRAVADQNWNLYSSQQMGHEDLPGHLLSYPISISENGEIGTIPGFECFPDTKARVLGTKSDYLPPILTT